MSNQAQGHMSGDTVRVVREGDTVYSLGIGVIRLAARFGLNVVATPLTLLPPQSRVRARRVIAEGALAVLSIPKELSNAAEQIVDRVYEESESSNVDRTQDVAERARQFSSRLSNAAREFGASITGTATQAADTTERAATKVDEWVETKTSTTKS